MKYVQDLKIEYKTQQQLQAMQRLWFQLSLMKQAQLQTIRLIKEDCDTVRYCGMLETYLIGNFVKEIIMNIIKFF